MGDPRLRMVAQPVDVFDTPELHELIEDMFDTMDVADGAGLAATQVGIMQTHHDLWRRVQSSLSGRGERADDSVD